MCGRFTIKTPNPQLIDLFGLSEEPSLTPRYNVSPTQMVPVIRTSEASGSRQIDMLRWGLIPKWAKDKSIGNRLINARSETVHEKPSFRSAFHHRRCLVVADGFYEWKRLPDKKRKEPYYFTMTDGGPFAFAGLWERWTDSDGAIIESCAVLTTVANDLLADVHDRMPVILPPENHDTWLDTTIDEPASIRHLFDPLPGSSMQKRLVGTLVNNPRNDKPACIDPVEETGGSSSETGTLFSDLDD